MFWIVLASQVATPGPQGNASSVVGNPDIEVTVERLPAGVRSPTFVRVKFAVDKHDRGSGCGADDSKGGNVQNHPALVRIACAQIMNLHPVHPYDMFRRVTPSVQSVLFRFSTEGTQAPAQPASEGAPYRGGPLDGIYVGEVMRPDNGVRFFGLKPSKPNASPVPAKDEPAVRAFIDAFERRDLSRLNGYLAKDAKHENCGHGFYSACGPRRPLSELKVAEDCTFNTPYYLGDHTVRLEWLYRGALWYWSELYLTDGRIRLVRTHPADMPPGYR